MKLTILSCFLLLASTAVPAPSLSNLTVLTGAWWITWYDIVITDQFKPSSVVNCYLNNYTITGNEISFSHWANGGHYGGSCSVQSPNTVWECSAAPGSGKSVILAYDPIAYSYFILGSWITGAYSASVMTRSTNPLTPIQISAIVSFLNAEGFNTANGASANNVNCTIPWNQTFDEIEPQFQNLDQLI
jgi:hypothetical protein